MTKQSRPRQILRFGVTERVFHWAQALPYLMLLGSGGLLLIQRQLQWELIPASTLILTHKIAGLTLPVLLLLVFVLGDTRTLARNAFAVLAWPGQALIGLASSTVSLLIPHTHAAPPDKFNAGQKFHMLMLMVLVLLFLVTGLFMWFGAGALLPWYAHVIGFLVALPLLAGHLFMALVHPSTRKGLSGMFTGRVDARWAHEEYGQARRARTTRQGRS